MGTQAEIKEIIKLAREKFTQLELAARLNVDAKTLRRWEHDETHPSPLILPALRQILGVSHDITETADHSDFTFIDLFAGIGGIRLGFEQAGGRCVFSSEWNTYAQKTYRANFRDDHEIAGDITKVDAETIPYHDVLVGGFPCQPFSLAGVSKKNSLGRKHGFEDKTQGTLFFDVARIIAAKRPKAFMLENVKNLRSHDKGKTFAVVLETLEKDLGYQVHWKVIDGQNFVPQHRERIIIVGFREPTDFSWDDLCIPAEAMTLKSVLHPQNGTEAHAGEPFIEGSRGMVSPKYTLSDKLWNYLQAYAAKHKAAGNGFGFGLVNPNSVSRTLSARYHKDGSEILVDQGPKKNPRRLTPRECARLMGFPDTFRIPVSDTRAYQQFGNSVIVPVMQEVARIMRPRILALIEQQQNAE